MSLTPSQFLDAIISGLTKALPEDLHFEDERIRQNYLLTQSIYKIDRTEQQVGSARLIAMWRVFVNGVEYSGEYETFMEYVSGELLPDPGKAADETARLEMRERRNEILKWARVVDVILSWLKAHPVKGGNGQVIDVNAMLDLPTVSQKLRSSVKMFRFADDSQREKIIRTIVEGTQRDIAALRKEILKPGGSSPAPSFKGVKFISDDIARMVIEVPVGDAPLIEMLLNGTVEFSTQTAELTPEPA